LHHALPAVDRLAIAYRRLDQVYRAAPRVTFDDGSRLVFFSDTHRGANRHTDAFAPNEFLFCRALEHYEQQGYAYVEVGDGDELWHNQHMKDICAAHPRSFELLHQFEASQRLHLLLGNHDLQGLRRDRIEKDGLVAREGLVLEHAVTGQEVFVVHGHQADLKSDTLSPVSRIFIRQVWRRLQRLGVGRATGPDAPTEDLGRFERWVRRWVRSDTVAIEGRIRSWLADRSQVVVCGHTHRPASARPGAPPYFNTGSCTVPGRITGLEIRDGWITPIRWVGQPSQGERGRAMRETTGPRRQLALLN
jgi:UDP-2,3-diacylglucosamine pyrophosphatase LpxH